MRKQAEEYTLFAQLMQKVSGHINLKVGQFDPKPEAWGILLKEIGITDSSFGQTVFVYKGSEMLCRYEVARPGLPIVATRGADGSEWGRRLWKVLEDNSVSLSLEWGYSWAEPGKLFELWELHHTHPTLPYNFKLQPGQLFLQFHTLPTQISSLPWVWIPCSSFTTRLCLAG